MKEYTLTPADVAAYAAATVNAKLSAINGLFRFLGWDDCRVKFLNVQRRMFRETARELLKYAQKQKIASGAEHARQLEKLGARELAATESIFC